MQFVRRLVRLYRVRKTGLCDGKSHDLLTHELCTADNMNKGWQDSSYLTLPVSIGQELVRKKSKTIDQLPDQNDED